MIKNCLRVGRVGMLAQRVKIFPIVLYSCSLNVVRPNMVWSLQASNALPDGVASQSEPYLQHVRWRRVEAEPSGLASFSFE